MFRVFLSDRDGMLWHSSAIEKRLKNKRLVTSSGSVCTLKGHMDKLQAKEESKAVLCCKNENLLRLLKMLYPIVKHERK